MNRTNRRQLPLRLDRNTQLKSSHYESKLTLVLELTEVLDGIGYSCIVFEARHHELLREAVRSDLLNERRVEDAQPIRLCLLLKKLTGLLDLLPNNLLYIFHSVSFLDFARPRLLRVLIATQRVTYKTFIYSQCERSLSTEVVMGESENPPLGFSED